MPLVADRFLVGRGYLDESANDPEVCDLAQAMGTPFDDMDFEQIKTHVEDAVKAPGIAASAANATVFVQTPQSKLARNHC